MPVEKGKKHHRKVLQRHSTGEAEKMFLETTPCHWFLHGNVPAHTSQIVMAFLRKEKVTFLPHLSYFVVLALCDFFMFPKLK